MTNKLVVIINSLKVPKIKKILLYEMKLLVPKYSCLQNPWLGSYRPQIPVLSVLYHQLNLLNPPSPEQNSLVRHWSLSRIHCLCFLVSFWTVCFKIRSISQAMDKPLSTPLFLSVPARNSNVLCMTGRRDCLWISAFEAHGIPRVLIYTEGTRL